MLILVLVLLAAACFCLRNVVEPESGQPHPEAAPRPEAPPIAPPIVRGDHRRMIELDEQGKLGQDVHCRQCGYNLRGLAPAGACPECHLPAERSMYGDELQFADPAWVHRLYVGMRLLVISIVVSIATGIIGTVAWAALGSMGGGGFPLAMAVMGLVMGLVGLLWVIAVWIVTTPDPGAAETESPTSARRIARWCMMATVISLPLETFMPQGNFVPAGNTGAMLTIEIVLLLIQGLVGLVVLIGTAAGFIYLRSLATRIPSPSLVKQTGVVGWGYVITSGLGRALGIVMMLIVPGNLAAGGAFPIGFAIVVSAACMLGLGSLVFGIWAIVLLIMYLVAFRIARDAAAHWSDLPEQSESV